MVLHRSSSELGRCLVLMAVAVVLLFGWQGCLPGDGEGDDDDPVSDGGGGGGGDSGGDEGDGGQCSGGAAGTEAFVVRQADGVEFSISPFRSGGSVEEFYGYGSPVAYSSNMDLEISNRTTMLFHEDPDGALSFIMVHDKPSDGSGGVIKMKIEGLEGGELVVEDDKGGGQDRYFYGNGKQFKWTWYQCCTDGMAVRLPSGFTGDLNGSCVTFNPQHVVGIEGFDLLQADGTRYEVSDGAATFELCSATCCPEAEVCDGYDNDCDGEVDEGVDFIETTCGEGSCASSGVQYCSASGELVNTCQATAPGPDDSSCDGVDDDCDGEVDEDYLPVPSTCSDGDCVGKGELVCEHGEVVDTCVIDGEADEVCDGVDNDCDGETDEQEPTLCSGVAGCEYGTCYCITDHKGAPSCVLE